MSFNHNLARASHQFRFQELGFIFQIHDLEDHRGNWWELKRNGFTISIDAWYEVELTRTDSNGLETDPIKIEIDDKSDLQALIDFIQPPE